MNIYEMILEYLKVLSWPLVSLFALWMFRKNIGKWIENVQIKHNGFSASPSQNLSAETLEKNDNNNEWHPEAKKWYFEYADYFLIFQSHVILDWFYNCRNSHISNDIYFSTWNKAVQIPNNTDVIKKALLNLGFLTEHGDCSLKITTLGIEYISTKGDAATRKKCAY